MLVSKLAHKPSKKVTLSAFLVLILLLLAVPFYFNTQLPAVRRFFSSNAIDTLSYAPGYPNVTISALEQLKHFPAPQFHLHHTMMPNFLWMDPCYLGGLLQPRYIMKECVARSTQIQAELATQWNYYFLVSSNLKVHRNYYDTTTFAGSWVHYANQHPEIKTGAISFWAQLQPGKTVKGCNGTLAYIFNNLQPDCCYVHNSKGELISRKYASPLTPVAALQCDFMTQSVYVDSLLKNLKRPLHMINENAEVIRLYEDDFLEQDQRITKAKEQFPELSWNEFQAMKRLEKELAYKNSFMSKKELQHCLYTVYAIDGQNNYRHDYKTMRGINSTIYNQHLSTPDFYPRYPHNWKHWSGPWHGLEWLEISRATEIACGDHLFSPFVAAGWDSVETNNIRPAQWLGLLKILGAMGAVYYYPGFFNTSKQVAKPENYIWQAVMPVYAQAISSQYEALLKNSYMIKNDRLIQYPESDVPVVIRKSNNSNEWIIACSWQDEDQHVNKKTEKEIRISLGEKELVILARTQGSVYYYRDEPTAPVFYQLDGWHENKHPYFWTHDIMLEAELYSTNLVTTSSLKDNYTNYTTAAMINDSISIPFEYHGAPTPINNILLWINNEGPANVLELYIDGKPYHKVAIKASNQYVTVTTGKSIEGSSLKQGKHLLQLRTKQKGLMLDKVKLDLN